jgi:amino acid adenylation domain-containing protein
MLIHDLLDNTTNISPNKLAVITDNETISYRELKLQSINIAKKLKNQGFKKGSKLLIVSNNCIPVVVLTMAASRLGMVFVILNDDIKFRNLEYIIQDSKPSLIFASERIVKSLKPLYDNVLDMEYYRNSCECKELQDTCLDTFVNEEDLACIVYTSGSTSNPKGVMINHHNVIFSTKAIQQRLKLKSEDIIGDFLPLSFDYGLYQLFLAFYSGATLALGQRKDVGPLLLKKIEKWNITCLPLVPSIASALIKLKKRLGNSTTSLRVITNTGEKLSKEVVQQLRELFVDCNIFLMYGLTECKRVSILDSNYLEVKPDSVGKPLEGTKCFIIDDQGEVLPYNSIGQLIVVGDNVTLGYWNLPQLTKEKFKSWKNYGRALFTGDLCSIDEDGFLYFYGRTDDIFKNKGFRVSTLEIEAIVEEIDGINKAIAIKPNENLNCFALYIVSELDPKFIWIKMDEVLEYYKIPDKIIPIKELPLTQNGKVNKHKLKELLLQT